MGTKIGKDEENAQVPSKIVKVERKTFLLTGLAATLGIMVILFALFPPRPSIGNLDQLVEVSRELMGKFEEYPFGLIPVEDYPPEIQRLDPFAVWVTRDWVRILPRVPPRQGWRQWHGFIVLADEDEASRAEASDLTVNWVPTKHSAIFKYSDDFALMGNHRR